MKNNFFGKVHIKDDFLPPSLFYNIKNHITSSEISWCYYANATHPLRPALDNDDYFSHVALWQHNNTTHTSPNYHTVSPLVYFIEDRFKFKIDQILRAHFTLIYQKTKNSVTAYHIDNVDPHYVGILYLNTCNGPTMVQNEKIDCVANRFVLFDGRYIHAAVHQTDTNYRMNIVFNFSGDFY